MTPADARNWACLEGLEFCRDGRLAMATMWPEGLAMVEDPNGVAAGNGDYRPLPMWEGNLAGYEQGVPFRGGAAVMLFDTDLAEASFTFRHCMPQQNEVELAGQSNPFSRRAHVADPADTGLQHCFADVLPARQQTLEAVFVRRGIPDDGSVTWQGTVDCITDVFSGDPTAEPARPRWVDGMCRAFARAGYTP